MEQIQSRKIGTCHFSVSGEWMTDFSRDLWAEGSYQRAINLLRCLNGIAYEQVFDILAGKLKLTEEMRLVEDNWKPNLAVCQRGRYPDPHRIFDVATEATERLEQVKQAEKALKEVVEDLRKREEEEEAECPPAFDNPVFNTVFNSLMEEAPPAIASDEMKGKAGWLHPNGDFYPCGYMQHAGLAYKLRPRSEDSEQELENEGFVKLGFSVLGPEGGVVHSKDSLVTQAQYDKIFDWCQRYGHDFPDHIRVK